MQTYFDGITKKPSYELPTEEFIIQKKQDDYIIYNKDSGGWIICNKEELALIYFQVGLKKELANFLFEFNIMKKNGNYFDPATSFIEHDKQNIQNNYNISDKAFLINLKEDDFDAAIKISNSVNDNNILSLFINRNRKQFLSDPEYDNEVKYFDNCINYMLREEKLLTDIDVLEVILNIFQCRQLSSFIFLVKKKECENEFKTQGNVIEECCSSCKDCMYKAICRYKSQSDQSILKCSRKYLYEKIFDMVLNSNSMNRICKELIENINMRGNEREM